MTGRLLCVVLLAMASMLGARPAAGDMGACAAPDHWLGGESDGDVFTVYAVNHSCEEAPGSDGGPPVFVERVEIPPPICGLADVLGLGRPCIDEPEAFYSFDGTLVRNTVFTRIHTEAGPGPWRLAYGGDCPESGDLEVLVREYFSSVALEPPIAGRQPEGAEGLVNMPLVLFADPGPQILTTPLGEWTVTITATPSSYAWDLGPAGEITTADPGAPYPDHTVAPEIRMVGEVPVTLTTSWLGTFQVAGSGMQYPVNGVATTVTVLEPITIREARTYLVTADY